VLQVVVVALDEDADEVRVPLGRRGRQRAAPLAGEVAERLRAVLPDVPAEAPGAVDQLVQARADRPRRRQTPHQRPVFPAAWPTPPRGRVPSSGPPTRWWSARAGAAPASRRLTGKAAATGLRAGPTT